MTLVPSTIGHYITGFVDGEGSFNISFRKRKDYVLPWKVSACFNISQKEKYILEVIQKHLGCGTLRSRQDGVWYYEVNYLDDICQKIIPFFKQFSFLSEKKRQDFATFCTIVHLLTLNKHLSREGIENICELRRTMNRGGKRKYSEKEIVEACKENPQRLHVGLGSNTIPG